ncbi:MAG: hypothetical protein GY768_16640, partial [Planctomycetaceae bacterium]|nr:hypothetical protein [Planctomycetaceae bacterium]
MHALTGNTSQSETMSQQEPFFRRLLDAAIDEYGPEAAAQAAEVAYVRNVELPTRRPALTIDHPPFQGPPQLGDEDPHVCPAPADGNCLYYCALALRNTRKWIETHDNNGQAREPGRSHDEMVEVRAIRYLVRDRARLVGDRSAYERLGLEGPEGYPGLDDVQYLAAVLG